jgi:RimJ/RimL family protein N-acetyltransferase
MIKGSTVNLRRLKIDDLPYILKWRQDAELSRYYDELPINMPVEIEQEIHTKISSPNRLDLIIETKKGEAIGVVFLRNIRWKDRNAELHAMVGEKDKRHIFFGVEAEFLLLLYAFRKLNMHKIYGRMIEYAKEQEALVKEIGFEKEVVFRKFIYQKGRYWDLYIYGLLDREFEEFLKSKKGKRYLTAFRDELENG